jgi:hypothetical protein
VGWVQLPRQVGQTSPTTKYLSHTIPVAMPPATPPMSNMHDAL